MPVQQSDDLDALAAQIDAALPARGQVEPGNIDLKRRPVVNNPDGSYSTVRSMSFGEDGKEVLVPTIGDDGRRLSDEEAVSLYRKTGKHLGKFTSVADADSYAKRLHEDQAKQYGPRKLRRLTGAEADSIAAESAPQPAERPRLSRLTFGRHEQPPEDPNLDAAAERLAGFFPRNEPGLGTKFQIGVLGATATAAKVPELAGKFAEYLGVPRGTIERHVPALKRLADWGRSAESAIAEVEDPRFASQDMASQLARGAGSMLPFAATIPIGGGIGEAVASRVPGAMGLLSTAGKVAGSLAGATILGQTAVPMYEDVLHATGDETKAWKAAFIGMGLDATEVEGLGEVFGNLAAPAQKTLRKALQKIAMGAVEEGSQEFWQQVGQEVATKRLTGEKLDALNTLVSSGRAGLVGTILGGGVGGAHEAASGALGIGQPEQAPGSQGELTPEDVFAGDVQQALQQPAGGQLSFPTDRAAAGRSSTPIALPFGTEGPPAAGEPAKPVAAEAAPETAAGASPEPEAAARALLAGQELPHEALTPEVIQKAVELRHTPPITPGPARSTPGEAGAAQALPASATPGVQERTGTPAGPGVTYAHTDEPASNSSVQPGDKLGPVTPTPIADLREFNPKKRTEAGKVAEIKADMEAGKPLPPVIAHREADGSLVIDDGSHRIAAAKELGYESVPVREVNPKANEPEAPRLRTADVVTSLRALVQDLENPSEDPTEEELPALLQRAQSVIEQRKASGQKLTELDEALSQLVSSVRLGPADIGSDVERQQSEHTLHRLKRARQMLDLFDAEKKAATPTRRAGEEPANRPESPESSPASAERQAAAAAADRINAASGADEETQTLVQRSSELARERADLLAKRRKTKSKAVQAGLDKKISAVEERIAAVAAASNKRASELRSPAVERPAAPESDLGGGPKQAAGSQAKERKGLNAPSAQAKRLRDAAAKLRESADEELGRDRQTNTRKRAREASISIQDAERRRQLAETMDRMADAQEAGEAGPLADVSTKAQAEELMRLVRRTEEHQDYEGHTQRAMELPQWGAFIHRQWLRDALKEAEGKRGLPAIRRALGMLTAGDGPLYVTDDAQLGAVRDLAGLAGTYTAKNMLEQVRDFERLRKVAGSREELKVAVEAMRALRDQTPGLTPEQKKAKEIKAAEEAVRFQKIPGFFPTPPALVSRVIDEAGIEPGMRVLEPSAGKGDLADAAREAGATVDTVEPQQSLRRILEQKGYEIVGDEFQEMPRRPIYDRIVMNPPFENGQDIDHVRHAYGMLAPGGKIVAIMSEGSFGRSDKRAVAFREWLDANGGTSEKVEAGAFKGVGVFRETGVSTRIVVVEKPADHVAEASKKVEAPPSDAAPFTKESIASTLGVDKEKAAAVDALASAMGLDKSKILLVKGGEPGAGALRQAAPGRWYFSNISAALDSWQPKGTREQLLAHLGKVKGALEEAKAIGLDEWLKDHPKVTRDDVQAYVSQNRIEIEEVEHSNKETDPALRARMTHVLRRNDNLGFDTVGDALAAIRTENPEHWEWNDTDDLQEAQRYHAQALPAQYAEYVAPGASSKYRELLLILRPIINEVRADILLAKIKAITSSPEYKSLDYPGGTELDQQIQTLKDEREILLKSERFTAGHFKEANVLAHVRLTDRTDDIGRKILFVEEVQSDWHQKGKKSGYRNAAEQRRLDAESIKAKRAERAAQDAYIEELRKLRGDADLHRLMEEERALVSGYYDEHLRNDEIWHSRSIRKDRSYAGEPLDKLIGYDQERAREEAQRAGGERGKRLVALQPLIRERYADLNRADDAHNAAKEAEREAARKAGRFADEQRGLVPAAPFRGAAWPRLAMKRILSYAAEHGYDGVAWTTGAMQAERYNLSKQVRQIKWDTGLVAKNITIETADGRYIQMASSKEGKVVHADNTAWEGKPLEDVIGKDIAKKIIGEQEGALAGEGLNIGGEGMRSFYDRELPSVANELGKKLGTRVGATTLEADEPVSVERASLRNGEAFYRLRRGGSLTGESFKTEAEAHAAVAVLTGKSVPFVPLDEQAREKIKAEGFPLFQGDKGAVEFTEGGDALIRALNSPDVSTGVHELAHVARRFLLDRGIPQDNRAGITDEAITVAEKWAGAEGGKWTTEAEEKFARGFERYMRDGKAPNIGLRDLFAKFKAWLGQIYARIKGSAIDLKISPAMRGVYDALVTREAGAAAPNPSEAPKSSSEPVQQETGGPDKPEPPPTAETSLREFIRAAGGLRFVGDVESLTRLEAGETKLISRRDKRSGKSVTVRVNTRAQPIVHNEGVAKGMSLDDAAEAAWEAGFFHERPDINELIDALEADKRHPAAELYEPTENERASADAQQRMRDIAMGLDDLGHAELLAFPGAVMPDVKAAFEKLVNRLGYIRNQKLFVSGVIPTESGTERAIRRWADSFRGVKTLQQATLAKGGTITDATDTYLQEELRRGRTKTRLQALDAQHIEPLTTGLRKGGISPEEFGEALMARHAPERNAVILARDPKNAAGSGMTDAEAAAIMARVKGGKRAAAFEAGFDRFDALMRETRAGWVRDGLKNQEEVDELERQFQHYAPLRSDLSEDADAAASPFRGTGMGIDVRGDEYKSAVGRHTQANPREVLAYALTQAEQSILRGEKNRVGQSFLNFLRANKDTLDGFAKINPPQAKRALVNGVVRNVYDPTLSHAPNALLVHENGEHVWIEIDPKYQNVADGLKNLGAEDVGKLIRYAGGFTRTLGGLSTRYNPVFPLFNALRDAAGAFINSNEHGLMFATRTVRDAPAALLGLMGKGTAKWNAHATEYIEDGAPVSFLDLNSYADQLKRIDKAVKARSKEGAIGSTIRGWRAFLHAIETATDIGENAVRFSGYVHAREDLGMSRERAASWAKNLTVNFERKGDNGAVMNALYMFSNAGIQSTARVGQAIRHPAVRRLLASAALGLMGWDQLQRMLGGKDDDGEDHWDKIPSFEKRHNFIFMFPDGSGRHVTIPAPFTYDLVQTLAFQLSGVMSGDIKPGAALGESLSAALETFDPVGSGQIDFSDPTSLVRAASPTVLDPLVELATNRDWKGDPIAPDAYPGENKPDSQRFWPSATGVSRAVTDWLNRATGGDEFKGGAIDLSPETLDHWGAFLSGGLGKTLSRLFEASNKPGASIGSTLAAPFAPRLLREPSPFASTHEFHELQDSLRIERDRAKRDKKLMPRELGMALRESNQMEETRQNRRKAIDAMPDGDAKKAALRALDRDIQKFNARARKALLTTP